MRGTWIDRTMLVAATRIAAATLALAASAFAHAATITVTPTPTGGKVTSNVGGINCGTAAASCTSANITAATSVTLTATPDAGFNFTSFTVTGVGTTATNPLTFPMPGGAVTGSVIFTAKTAQTITFPSVGTKLTSDAPFTVSATASSGLTVTFSVVPGSACSIAGNTVTLTGISGTCSIAADQAGNATFAAAPQVVQAIPVKIPQSILFPAVGAKSTADAPFTVAATSSSGLAVTFSVVPGSVCTIVGSTVTLTGASGTCSIAADQGGNGTFAAAIQIVQAIAVRTPQSITFPSVGTKLTTDAPFTVAATSTSGLAVTFSVVPVSVCTITGNTVTLSGASGTCSIAADQAGNGTFAVAPQVVQAIAVRSLSLIHI